MTLAGRTPAGNARRPFFPRLGTYAAWGPQSSCLACAGCGRRGAVRSPGSGTVGKGDERMDAEVQRQKGSVRACITAWCNVYRRGPVWLRAARLGRAVLTLLCPLMV